MERVFPIVRVSLRWRSCDPCRVLTRSLLNFPHISTPVSHTSTCPQAVTHFRGVTRLFCTSGHLSTSPSRNTPPIEHSGRVVFVEEKRFNDSQEPHQFLSGDWQTIVCVHPIRPTPISESKPLRPLKSVEGLRDSLTPEEVKVVRRLRSMDGALWTVNTLARHFNVRRRVIREVAPANLERQKELDEERAKMESMKPYKRKLYKAQKQMERQKRLEELVARNREMAHHKIN